MKAKMEELARASGFSVGELFGGRGKRAKALPSTATPRTHRRRGPAVAVGRFGWPKLAAI